MTLLLIPRTAFLSLTDIASATTAATPEATTSTPTQGFILYLLLSICNWYCIFLDTPFLQIIPETKLVHLLPPRPITHSSCCTTWKKQWSVSCYKIECMQLDLFLMLLGLCYLDTNWNAHFTLTYPAGTTAGAVAGVVLGVIVVVACVGIIIITIWRYRLSTYGCVNTLSILVLQLYFTFITQTKTETNNVIPW